MYKENEYVMYKNDVCFIKEIKTINNNKYYVLIPLNDKTLIINTPVINKQNYIRNIISKKDALNLINEIKYITPLDTTNKNLENEYKELLNTNDKKNLIKIIKTIYLKNIEKINNNKKICDKDKYYFEKAEMYLYNELSISLNKNVMEIKNLIKEKCK